MRKTAIMLLALSGLVISAYGQDVISTVVGGGPNGIPGVDANLDNPYEVAVDTAGNVYVAAAGQNRIFKLGASGTITVVAGNGEAGYGGDGGPAAEAELNGPWGVAVDAASPANVYIGDTTNCLVRKVDQATGVITTIAGLVVTPESGSPYPTCGYSGNGGKANAAMLYGPAGIAVNSKTDDVYVAEFYNGIVRKIAGGNATGTITTVAGGGGSSTTGNNCGSSAPYGDGSAATSAYLCYPQGVTLDTSVTPANLLISEYIRCDVREVVGSSAKIYQLAGSYSLGCGFKDKVTATSGQLNDPWQMQLSVSGSTTTVKVADFANSRIRQFTLTYAAGVPKPGLITTIGGKGVAGFCNDKGPVLNACMGPIGLAYDASGDYYIGDYGSSRIRKVAKSNNEITTIAGWGANGGTNTNYSDPVGLKNETGSVSLYYPDGVFADPDSTNVYVGGYQGEAVYLWDSSSHEVSTFAGNGIYGFAGDKGAASSATAELAYPIGIGKDSSGNVYIADSNNCVIREVSASTGDITTIAGGTSGSLNGCGYSGDGGSAVDAKFNGLTGIALDAENNIYVADYSNCAIRKISAANDKVSTIAGGLKLGCGYSGDGGPATAAKMREPNAVATDGAGNIYFSDTFNYRVREIVAATGIIQTVAGDGVLGFTGDGPALSNELNNPAGVTADANGNLFISDQSNHILRWVTPSGQMITFAGTAPGSAITSAGFSGDGGPALKAQLYYPFDISRDSEGTTYVADEYNHRVRSITAFPGYGLSTDSLPFPNQAAGSIGNFQSIKLSAVGPTAISGITVTSGFGEIDDCVGETLTAGDTCEIDVDFQPTAAGTFNGKLTINSNAFFAANPKTVGLSGTASGLGLSGSLAFGTTSLNTPVQQSVTLTNSGSAVSLTKIYLTETTDFSISGGTCPKAGGTLGAGGNCTVIVSFSPQSVGAKKSTLVVTSNDPASPLLAGATGTGSAVEISTSSIDFGSISYGTTAIFKLTISNKGTASFTLTPSITGTGFSLSSSGKTCTTILAAGKSCVLPVEYKPAALGTSKGTLAVKTNGGYSPSIPLMGTATSDISVVPSSLSFGTIKHATTKILDLKISNIGKISSLTVKTSTTGTGAAAFTLPTTGYTCGSGVAPGKSCTLPVEFRPGAAAAYSATLTLTTNGGTNPTVKLSGTGN